MRGCWNHGCNIDDPIHALDPTVFCNDCLLLLLFLLLLLNVAGVVAVVACVFYA